MFRILWFNKKAYTKSKFVASVEDVINHHKCGKGM